MHIRGLNAGKAAGKNTETATGDFVHTGGWLHVHADNSVEVNLMQC